MPLEHTPDRSLIPPNEKEEKTESMSVDFIDFTNEDIEKYGLSFITLLCENDLDRRWLINQESIALAKAIISLEETIERIKNIKLIP
jgi:hypothetical protein